MFLNMVDRNRGKLGLWADLDRLSEELSHSFLKSSQVNGYSHYPAVNLYQNEEEIVVTALIPGLTSDTLEMSVIDNRFTIKGNPKKENKEGYTTIREEIASSEFMRSFDLPFKINSEKVGATLKNGVLVVKLPKAEEEKAKKISVKSE